MVEIRGHPVGRGFSLVEAAADAENVAALLVPGVRGIGNPDRVPSRHEDAWQLALAS